MFSSSLCFPTHITSVLSRFIFRPCFLNMSFHSSSAPCHSSRCSATITRSSAYIIFLRASIVLIFLLISSITKMKSNGLRALLCFKPMFTWNSFDIPDPTTTLALVFSYMASTILTSDSGAPIHLRVVIAIRLGTVSKAFSRSTKAKAIYPCFSNLFSTSCLSENIPLVVPRPFLKPSCSSPNSGSTLSRNRLSRILSIHNMTQQSYPSVLPWVLCISFPFPYGDK